MVARHSQENHCMRVASSLVVAPVFVLALASCEADLGTCNMTAATDIVYAADGTPYYPGQAIVQQSCAGGFCHASGAVDANRFGAPHGLNFDVVPLTATATESQLSVLHAGISKVRDEANDMWGQIDADTMPPGDKGKRMPQSWTDGTNPVDLDIQNATGKATVRNWLACGAPIVAGVTGAPAQAMALGNIEPGKTITVGPTFDSVYTSILKGTCISCHVKGTAFYGQTPMDFSTEATAYATLVNQDASTTGSCTGKGKLVVPGDCAHSLIWEKLAATTPAVCGSPMPLGMAAIADSARQGLCDWINAGAKQ
jgi:hypothetical protein